MISILRSGFETKDLRASGQVLQEVRGYTDILNMTLAAWESLERRIFQAAWISCGYFDSNHMLRFDSSEEGLNVKDLTQKKAETELSDIFSVCGDSWTPQRCTRFEWQLKDKFGFHCQTNLTMENHHFTS